MLENRFILKFLSSFDQHTEKISVIVPLLNTARDLDMSFNELFWKLFLKDTVLYFGRPLEALEVLIVREESFTDMFTCIRVI